MYLFSNNLAPNTKIPGTRLLEIQTSMSILLKNQVSQTSIMIWNFGYLTLLRISVSLFISKISRSTRTKLSEE